MGRLYTQRVIEEGQSFLCTVETPPDLSAAIDRLVSALFTAGIGTGRSRGQGWVDVQRDVLKPQSWGAAKDRFGLFSGNVLAVTFLSDTILQDVYLRDRTAPDISHLIPLGIKPDEWEREPCSAFAARRTVFGFDGFPLQLPRQPRLAVSAGSVFLYKAKPDITPSIPDGDGIGWIGEKNNEGYGKVILWHSFHSHSERKEDADK